MKCPNQINAETAKNGENLDLRNISHTKAQQQEADMNKSRQGAMAMAATLMALGETANTTTNSFKALSAAIGDNPLLVDSVFPSKGKRSKRRRAAKMRAKGWIHLDGTGWLHPSEYQPISRDQIA